MSSRRAAGDIYIIDFQYFGRFSKYIAQNFCSGNIADESKLRTGHRSVMNFDFIVSHRVFKSRL
ncbi:hypothetical protein [Aquimarina celericrescens]|uniref:Uncharacterized protein n=1 Tax=Aquimarina celericrescens TaxID=1964542 RepID=A0ABW5AU23_9FLAO